MRVEAGNPHNRAVNSRPVAGPLRFKELNETIAALQERNARLCAVNAQCKTALLALCKHATCAVCLDVLYDPLVLICPKQCMQNMCSGCFMKTDRRCPTCKEPTLTSISCGYAMHSVLGCVPRECDDCHCMIYPTEKHTTLQQCALHRTVCLDAELDCCNKPHGCSATYKRKNHDAHVKHECAHIPCANFVGRLDGRSFGCMFRGTANDVAEHERTCELERDVQFLFNRLVQYQTNDDPPTPGAYEPIAKCKNVEHLIGLLRNEHRSHY